MSAKKMGLGKNQPLGRGLQALGLKEHPEPHDGAALEIDIDLISPNPKQPRRAFSDEALQSLAESIRQYGLIQPVVVQKKGGAYELIAGERRLRAAKLCGLTKIPAVVRDCAPQASAELALIENLQREDLDPVEEASAYRALIQEFGLTQEQAAEKVGRSRVHVSNMMRLLQLPEEIQQYLIDGVLSIGQARPLLQLKDRQAQMEAAARIIDQELSARQVEAMVRAMLREEPPKDAPEPDAYLESMQDRMKMHLGTNVAIRLGRNKKKGKIEISFASEEEFERLLAILTDEPEDGDSFSPSSFRV
ncbi:ParB/RepB/Spo0J family partition protein [Megasphaera stantonii]|uniref:ParB/RepB/Spo0J family partition protein n=1 Tax=Megasphaera stantonii TaxID=2144175 RepID=UPI002942FC02|nr:ParB/RepB/Spo0J family partition protein [Megasphaera stantonii]